MSDELDKLLGECPLVHPHGARDSGIVIAACVFGLIVLVIAALLFGKP